MTRISFTIEEHSKVAEICAILTAHGVKNLASDETLPNHILKDVEESLSQSNSQQVIPNDSVHKKARELCIE